MKYIAPSAEIVADAIEQAGGIREVAEHLQKSERALYYWITGKRNIDFANWCQIRTMANYNY
jgi:spermidine/putrescine-binding protein